MGTFTRDEFLGGMQRLGCDDSSRLRTSCMHTDTTCKATDYHFTQRLVAVARKQCGGFVNFQVF
eukprot:799308-Amphidinium_carterae.1